MDPTSDPLDVAVALAQAMGPTDSDKAATGSTAPSTGIKDKLWAGFLSPQHGIFSSSSSNQAGMLLYPSDGTPLPPHAQQSDMLDPLDANSCLSLLQTPIAPNAPAANTAGTAAASAASLGVSIEKAWHQQHPQHQHQHQQHHQMSSSDYNSNASSADSNISAASGLFFPPTPPVESPAGHHFAFTENQQAFAPWLAMSNAANSSGVFPAVTPRNHSMDLLGMSGLWHFPQGSNNTAARRSSSGNGPAAATNMSSRQHGSSAPRRKSSPGRPYRRRTSSQPSVASVVSLSAHEPVAHLVNGVEHITFLYSHDRLVKEYTVRTDVDSCSVDEIPADFRMVNAIYPRANVDRDEYDGNRWEYETSCNTLGWKLCWLNQEQLCGRRGLIQRAVDSYRNRHAHMRSRRVTRQEKVANGTLRRRRAKRC